MSGTGGQSPVEHHLGDRLAALVDGELCHDTRDRVLAHLATCRKCKAEADAQRRLKDVFSATAPPPPSDGLLARLQGLPGLDDEPPPGGPGGNPFRRGRARDRGDFGLPAGGPGDAFDVLAPAAAVELPDPREGFRIHEIGRPGGSASRGRRFAFVAAGAVSFAAIALGGALPIDAAVGGGSPASTPGGHAGHGGGTQQVGGGLRATPTSSASHAPGGALSEGGATSATSPMMIYPYGSPVTPASLLNTPVASLNPMLSSAPATPPATASAALSPAGTPMGSEAAAAASQH